MTGFQKDPVTYSIRIANPISHLTIKFYNIEITALKFFSISANFCLQDVITPMTAFVDVQVKSKVNSSHVSETRYFQHFHTVCVFKIE